MSRRRFLTISAAAAALPGRAWAQTPVTRWRGAALGAGASMTLVGMTGSAAGDVFTAVEAEVARLEAIFSLHHPGSALNRLNRTGRLVSPPTELLELLVLSGALHRITDGAFDPTVQPLWELHAISAARGEQPTAEALAKAGARCGWSHLRYDAGRVSFARKGMALTFNGIAQGFIADRVAALLRTRGLRDVLIDMGEIAALGRRPDGGRWRAGVATPDGVIVREVKLAERALATSAPRGTLLDPDGRVGHIFDPRSGQPAGRWSLVSVAAGRAALADGLSTAFCLMDRSAIAAALAQYPGASLEVLL
ncbi:FAD:protein FMN transferase [Pelagibius litoralis]|uniref:FAD:protein FMN transferase n=2 Tax=Pelagibius litoralis TaxID=374515 RepID=A0A967EYF0_9PROT|nr:FAD:protein FMN transferase [Pelagibius litoralis]